MFLQIHLPSAIKIPQKFVVFECVVRNSVKILKQQNDCSFDEILQHEIIEIMKMLNPKKSAGPDQIPNRAIIELQSSSSFVTVISNVFNSCLRLSHFPSNWKNAKIIPVPKQNPPSSVDDFRPISLISCLGKIFEKILLNRLCVYE